MFLSFLGHFDMGVRTREVSKWLKVNKKCGLPKINQLKKFTRRNGVRKFLNFEESIKFNKVIKTIRPN